MTAPRAPEDNPADPFLSEQDLLERGQIESSPRRTPAAPAEDPLLAFLPETPDPPAARDARRARWPRAVLVATCGAAAAFVCWAGLAFSWRATTVDPVSAASAAAPAPQSGDESRAPVPHRQPRASAAPVARGPMGEERPAIVGDPRAAPPTRQLPVHSLVHTGLPPYAALDALPAVARDSMPDQPVMESSDVPAVSDLASSGAVSAAATIAPVRAADGNVAIETAASAVHQVLAEYKAAYDALNATAAAAVWPTVDQPALARAFSMLESQTLALGACDVTVGDVTARARCRGSIRAVPRVGSSAPVIVAQTWVFSLRQSDAGWQIQEVTASDSSDDPPTDSSR